MGLARLIRSRADDLHVPGLCDVEVASALRKLVLGGVMSPERAAEALGDYLRIPVTRHGHELLLARIFSLRDNFTAYDASYLALAEALGAQFLTLDESLRSGVRALLDVELVLSS